MVNITMKGDFKKTNSFFDKALGLFGLSIFDKYGKRGVEALRSSTPVDSGKTSDSWYYEVTGQNNRVVIYWNNSNINDGVNVAMILQYGHGTQNGHFVKGIDYINPALKNVFEELANEAWKELTSG